MKIAIFSDLHNEFTPWLPPKSVIDADVVILAGDIDIGDKGIEWAAKTFKNIVIFVPGNHEYYGGTFQKTNKKMRETAKNLNVHFLLDNKIIIDNICFIGATLWTDFNLYNNKPLSASYAELRMQDYKRIRFSQGGRYRKLTVGDTTRLHSTSKFFIQDELQKHQNYKRVVITHHCPSGRCIPPLYQGDTLSPAYASNLEELIKEHKPNLWVFGHTHGNADFTLGDTRVIANQRGYIPEEPNNSFIEDLIIEL